MAAKTARSAKLTTPVEANTGQSLDASWDSYRAATIGESTFRRLPGVERLVRTAYFAGAGEATLQIGEAQDRDEAVKRLSRESEAGLATVVTPR